MEKIGSDLRPADVISKYNHLRGVWKIQNHWCLQSNFVESPEPEESRYHHDANNAKHTCKNQSQDVICFLEIITE